MLLPSLLFLLQTKQQASTIVRDYYTHRATVAACSSGASGDRRRRAHDCLSEDEEPPTKPRWLSTTTVVVLLGDHSRFNTISGIRATAPRPAPLSRGVFCLVYKTQGRVTRGGRGGGGSRSVILGRRSNNITSKTHSWGTSDWAV